VSQENVEIIRRASEALARLDLEEWMAGFDDEVKLYPRREEPGVEPFYEGKEGIGAYLGNWYSGWQEYSSEPVQFIDAGDYVVVDVREVGVAKGSGIRVEHNFAHAFKVGGRGKVVEWRMFGPVEEALAALEVL
jgi:ketosteroid isomerase-like protein